MTVPGIVTNITNFGVFVDIGVKQDGLVHVSQLSNRFVSDPNEIVKLQQHVMVTVMEVDAARKRISLSMKEKNEPLGEKSRARESIQQKPNKKEALAHPSKKVGESKIEAKNDFESKLIELKKKFKS
jgi:protein Tex